MKQGNLVWRLMRRNLSVSQIGGYALANLVGLTIMLVALQLYRDTNNPRNGDDTLINQDYLVISKQVTDGVLLSGGSTDFTPEEIARLKKQPWVESVGEFTPARFMVDGTISLGGATMSSHIFFESIPDAFIDVKPEGWKFDPTEPDPVVPIIISKDYVALYNFGFAPSRGMPIITESNIESIPIRLRIRGNGNYGEFKGRIIDFSSRINSIAVPEEFMTWANEVFGETTARSTNVSRLIVKAKNPGAPEVKKYFEQNNIEVAGDKEIAGQTAYFLSTVSVLSFANGIVISLLSFFILMLSIFLLLQKNREKIHDLMMLGYTPRHVAYHYYLLVGVINAVILVIACVLLPIIQHWWGVRFDGIKMQTASLAFTILVGFAIMAVVTFINILAIRRIVRRNF